ncbi:MAG: hypothetical protein KDD66_05985 [Bdellovibrionales bacterium]|nr:hypothetical protein [Bdellovibrionales bacterium]
MVPRLAFLAVLMLYGAASAFAAPWTEQNAPWNMNFNSDGSDPSKYFGQWKGHTYFTSPDDWRDIPVYHVMIDRFSDGNPLNNDGKFGGFNVYNPTMRQGGDLKGLRSKLDYIAGMGFRAIWVSAVFQNAHNDYHGYGPIDFTLVDDRLGTIKELRLLVEAAHKRGIYVIVDVVVNHLNNFIYTKGNRSRPAPFRFHDGEYELEWFDGGRRYQDFNIENKYYADGKYCDVYNNAGEKVEDKGRGSFWDSDFHHNGDLSDWTDPWSRQLGEVYGFLDDLRTTHPRVQNKITAMTKAMIATTDIDGIRMDSPMLVPLCFFKHWAPEVRKYAAELGKKNFGIFGEFYNTYEVAATMIGRGKSADQYGTSNVIDSRYLMDGGINYRLYHQFFLPVLYHELDGYMSGAKNQLDWGLSNFDLVHPPTGETRYRMWNFYDNHDQRRMCITPHGPEKNRLAAFFISTWPGIPLFYYGDEQGLCSYGTALEGHSRESFMTSIAWKDHPSPVGENPASGDNFNMTHRDYLYVQQLMEARQLYPALRHNNSIVEHYAPAEGRRGIYAFSRSTGDIDSTVLVIANTSDKALKAEPENKIKTPWGDSRKIVNVLNPSESYFLSAQGELLNLSVDSFEGKIFVLADHFRQPKPKVIMVSPPHDAVVEGGTVLIKLAFSEAMRLESVKSALTVDGKKVSSGKIRNGGGGKFVTAELSSLEDGLHHIALGSEAQTLDGREIGINFSSRFKIGTRENVLLYSFARKDGKLINDGTLTSNTESITIRHKAVGAKYFRVSSDGGFTWGPWTDYEPITTWNIGPDNGFRKIVVQYWADGSSAYFAEDWIDRYRYDGFPMK